jgi:hypothetical protein
MGLQLFLLFVVAAVEAIVKGPPAASVLRAPQQGTGLNPKRAAQQGTGLNPKMAGPPAASVLRVPQQGTGLNPKKAVSRTTLLKNLKLKSI